jgi:hypothetical protein
MTEEIQSKNLKVLVVLGSALSNYSNCEVAGKTNANSLRMDVVTHVSRTHKDKTLPKMSS